MSIHSALGISCSATHRAGLAPPLSSQVGKPRAACIREPARALPGAVGGQHRQHVRKPRRRPEPLQQRRQPEAPGAGAGFAAHGHDRRGELAEQDGASIGPALRKPGGHGRGVARAVGFGSFLGIQQGRGSGRDDCLGAAGAVGSITAAKSCGRATHPQAVRFVSPAYGHGSG